MAELMPLFSPTDVVAEPALKHEGAWPASQDDVLQGSSAGASATDQGETSSSRKRSAAAMTGQGWPDYPAASFGQPSTAASVLMSGAAPPAPRFEPVNVGSLYPGEFAADPNELLKFLQGPNVALHATPAAGKQACLRSLRVRA